MSVLTIKKDVKVEFTEKKSVFIGHAFFVSTEEQALEKLDLVAHEHGQATHNVYAYSLRQHGVQRCSDAGEPQGTAGMPVLKVITLNGLVDVCIVVTRYFGGILLGAGGLVRAYTKAAAMAVEEAGKTEIILATTFLLEYGYELHENVMWILEKYGATVTDRQFTDKVEVAAVLPSDELEKLKNELNTLYYSRVTVTDIDSTFTRK